jgi:hypothetical protein
MLLLTKEIKKALPPLYTTENIPLQNKIIICKFFTPDANWTWYVFEGSPESNGDFTFFGIIFGDYPELGYFNYYELLKCRGRFGLPIERDRSVFKVPCLKLLKQSELSHFLNEEELKCLP